MITIESPADDDFVIFGYVFNRNQANIENVVFMTALKGSDLDELFRLIKPVKEDAWGLDEQVLSAKSSFSFKALYNFYKKDRERLKKYVKNVEYGVHKLEPMLKEKIDKILE